MSSDAPIDLVFLDFISSRVLGVLNSIQTFKNYTKHDLQPYSPILTNEALGLYAQTAWNYMDSLCIL